MLTGLTFVQAAQHETPNPSLSPAATQRAFLNRYCVTCHNEKLNTAGLMLDKMDVENISVGAEAWEKVVGKLRTAAMPPAGLPRPDKAAYDSFATYLETALDKAAETKFNPGRPAIHRLNRAEYANAVRDLLGLEIDAQSLLPADESGYGFDNNGDVLSVSPMLMDRYISAARQIDRLALGDVTIRPVTSKYDVPKFFWQNERVSEDLPFGSRGGIAVHHNFPLDGDYLLQIHLQNRRGHIIGLAKQHQLDVRLDGTRIKLVLLGGETKGKAGLDINGIPIIIEEPDQDKVEAGLQFRLPVKAGERTIQVAFLDEGLATEGMQRPTSVQFLATYGWGQKNDSLLDPGVASISVSGPFDVKGSGETTSRQKIFVCRPAGEGNEQVCAKQILSTLARRAYRQPVTDQDVQGLLNLYKSGRSGGFEAGIGRALQGILVSRKFLFRIERVPANVPPDTPYRISDLDLASRLSFFLWSSIPDDQLLDLAARGKLKDRAVLQQQVQRMLADPRSKAIVDNFGGQWLDLRSVRSSAPDENIFGDFDESLRKAFQVEMELFLDSMIREDHPVPELLNANYTFVNERLARHYGIPDIYGSHFRRVILTDEARMGLLGKGSILLTTSFPNRTSPVLRGKWVMGNILGTPPPPPPPNVPDLQDDDKSQRLTMRQRMEQHRANPACASCHSRMDPIGFALDNFDAIGRWRNNEMNQSWNGFESEITSTPVDASGVLPDGTKFSGPAGLQKVLLSHPEQFVATVTEKLLTYALGRGVDYTDQPYVRQIMREAAANHYRWSAIVLGIVKSAPFQMRMSGDQPTAVALR
jgi:hypothetical protein